MNIRKVLVVNDPAQAQLLYYSKLATGIKRLVETDDDYQTTTAFDQLATSPDSGPDAEGAGFNPAAVATDETIAQANLLRILGFGDFEGADIVEVLGAKGVAGVKQVSTLTLSALTATAGTELIVDIEFASADLRGEFASHLSDYKRKKSFVVPILAGDTVTTVAARLVADIQGIIDAGWAAWITASSAAGVVTITSTDAEITFKITTRGTAVVTAAFATTTAGYEGRNTYEQLKALRLETVNCAYGEEFKTKQVPQKGAKYSSYIIKKTVSRPDLVGLTGALGSIPSGVHEFEIYINEATAASVITELTKWLNANVAKRTMYTSTTAAGVLGGDPVDAQTVVDSTEPFTTGLI
jgi:hypothetical protein